MKRYILANDSIDEICTDLKNISNNLNLILDLSNDEDDEDLMSFYEYILFFDMDEMNQTPSGIGFFTMFEYDITSTININFNKSQLLVKELLIDNQSITFRFENDYNTNIPIISIKMLDKNFIISSQDYLYTIETCNLDDYDEATELLIKKIKEQNKNLTINHIDSIHDVMEYANKFYSNSLDKILSNDNINDLCDVLQRIGEIIPENNCDLR